MRNIYLLIGTFIFAHTGPALAQCPPPGFPQSGNTCVLAPILCENLDGYCNTINNNNTQQPFPGCPNNVLNNDEWFGFYAGSTTIEIQVIPSNCNNGPFMGLQAGIYDNCINGIMDLQCPCSTAPFSLFSTNFVIGEVYYFVIDGCGGNVCDYEINVLQGSTVGEAPDDPGPITGPDTVCVGDVDVYSIPPAFAATIYTWSTTPALGTINNPNQDQNTGVTWGNTPGTTQLCVLVSNLCYPNPTPSCMTVVVIPKPTATISGSGDLCSGGTETIDLTVTLTGTPPWQFVYTFNGAPQPPITTSTSPYTITIDEPGNYGLQSVTTVGSGCLGTVSGTANIANVAVIPTATTVSATCSQNNGSVNLTATGGVQPYTYNWSNGANTEDLTNIGPGTYSVTVTDVNGCLKDLTVTVTNDSNEPTITSTTTPSICGVANGDINITVTGGDPPYEYDWSTGETTEDLNDVVAGSYTVTVTAADGCTQTHTVTLTNDDPPISISGTMVANTTCPPVQGNGSVTITISPATAPGGGSYTIAWSTGDMGVTSLSNLPTGSYSVTVTTGSSCEGMATFTVPDQPNEPTLSSTTTNSQCGLDNGDINVSVSGGVPPFTFLWGNGETSEDLNDVPSGSYSVTVTGANGCTDALAITLSNTNPPISISSNMMGNTTCAPVQPNGSISITISPATAPGNGAYDIDWSTGDSNVTSLSNLPPGSYAVTVSAGGECTQTANFTVPDQPNLPTLSASNTPASCGLSNGSATIAVSGGVPPYTILWSNGQSTNTISGMPGGSYGVTVTGANGCSAATSATVPDNPIIFTITPTIAANTSCNPPGNGSITLTVTPPGTYTYLWGNGNTTNSIADLPSGSYSVTVGAGGNCTQATNFTVPLAPNVPALSFDTDPASCGLNNGATIVFTSGGAGPFTYQWSNGANTPNNPNLVGGTYSVTVTGSNGCSAASSTTVPDNQIPISITETITPNTSCLPPGNGGISISVTPATATITWSNGSNLPTLNNLPAGSYSVTVSAGGTCTQTETFTVPDNSELPSLDAVPTPTECNLENGAIDLTISGGLPPYTIQWSNGLPPVQNQGNIPQGNYAVTVTTSTGCSAQTSVFVPNNDVSFTIGGFAEGNTSCDFPNGNIQLTVDPPGNYTFIWDNGETTPILFDIPAGNYSVTVSAGGSCTQSASFDVFEFAFPPNLTASASAATCGLQNGSVNLTVDGASPPFTFDWSNGIHTEDLANVVPGTYTVTVTDAYDCTATASATVGSNNVPINLSAVPSANTSCLSANGGINLTISPAGTYTIVWSNSANTEDLNNLPAGSYAVTVSSGTCMSTATYTVPDNTSDPVLSEAITAAICGEPNGAINLTVTGATLPHNFTWSNTATTEDIANLLPGDYTVTVSGANGCSATATYNVPNNSSNFSIAGTASPLTSCTTDNGGVNLTITPSGSYTILWSNSANTEDLANLPPGTYTVTVTESGSCSASASFVVDDETTFPALSQTVTEEICGQENGGVNLTVVGTSAPFEFIWSNAETTEDLTGLAAGSYTVTVTGANGCSATASATVPDNSVSINLSGTPSANTSCDVNNGSINLTISPSGTYDITWSNMATTEDISGLAGGGYAVTVSAGGNCTAAANFTVPSTTADPVLAQTADPAVCGEADGGIDLDVTAGVGPFVFEWSNSTSNEDINNVPSGPYSVTVTGANGCASIGSYTVPENAIVISINGTTQANSSCDNANGSVDISLSPAGSYVFVWSNSQTTEDLSNLPPGNYTVTVTEGQTCTAEANFIVDNDTNAPDISPAISAAECGEATGGINLTATGGTTPYDFEWSNTETTEDLADLPPGDYGVTVTGADGCANTGSYTVPDNPVAITIDAVPSANSSCDMANGEIDLNISPSGSYNILWSNSETTEDLTGLPSGNYAVTVTLGQNCTAEATAIVDNDTNAPDISPAISAAFCGEATGGINLTATGGSTPYDFEWSNAETTEDLADLPPGNYNVTVTGADGCADTGSYTVPDDVVNLQLSGTETANTACSPANGGINLTISPSGSYDIIWSNSEVAEDLADLAPGDYEVTVSAGGTCTAVASFTVADQPGLVSLSENITASICGQPDGSIDLEVTGGTSPYQFNWSNSETTEDLTGITSGDYDVTVTAANGCTATGNYNVPNNSNTFSLSGSASPNTLCGATNGSINLTVTPIGGGTGPYNFEWSNAAITEDLNGLAPGDYEVTVTDGGSCSATIQFAVGNDAPTVEVSGSDTDILCFGEMTGAISLTATGGVAPYQFDWSPALPGSPEDPANLAAGPYSVTVTDASGCTGEISFSITQPADDVQVSCSPTAIVSAPGNTDGAAAVNVSGGTAPYLVDWSPGGSQGGVVAGSFPIINLAEGPYSVVVTDANGCGTTCNFLITSTECEVVASLSASPVEILDCTVETITLNGMATGATTATFAWFVDGVFFSSNQNVQIDEGGDYVLIVTDATTGCADTTDVAISDNTDFPPLFVDPAEELNCLQTQVTISGGSPVQNVDFSWATIVGTDTTVFANGDNTVVGQAGTYWLIGMADNGCINAIQVTVSADFSEPSANAGLTFTIGCNGGGTSNLDGTASTGDGTLSFFWETLDGLLAAGQNTATPGILEPGTYTLTVTQSSNGCTDTDEVTITTDGPQVVPVVVNPDCYGEPGSLILQDVQGGTPPYQYSIDGGQNFAPQNIFLDLPAGVYDIVVQDAIGCDDAATATITQPDSLYVLVTEPQVFLELGDSYQILTQVSVPESQIASVVWTPSTYLDCADCLNPLATPEMTTNYLVTVVDTNGCEDSAPLALFVDRRAGVYVPNAFSPNGDGTNEVFMIFSDPKDVVRVKSFLVFSRWGETVFEYYDFQPNNPAYGWDGEHRGLPMNPAVFAWFAVVEFVNGEEVLFEGDVALTR